VAESSYPFDSANAGEPEWVALFGPGGGIGSGVVGGPGSASLQVTADGVGTRQVYVAAGASPISAFVYGFGYKNDASKTLALAANASGNPRIDTIVLKLDLTANTIIATAHQGTPGASPVPPTLTNTSTVKEIPLADVFVANGATSLAAGTVTLSRRAWLGQRTFAIETRTTPLPPEIQPGAQVWIDNEQVVLTYAGTIAGLIDPREPAIYQSTTVTAASPGGANVGEYVLATLTIPASAGGSANRYAAVSGRTFLNFTGAPQQCYVRLRVDGVDVDLALLTTDGSAHLSHFIALSPAAHTVDLTMQRVAGPYGVSSSPVATLTNVKAAVTPTH
jgi:hypothetical protein